jgi:hypothetical protein
MRLRIVPALVLIAGLLGWNQTLPAATTGTHKLIDSHLSDSQMEAVLRAKLAKSKMANEGWTVHVHNKTATWEGKTNIIQHKGAATRMAHSAGATQVINNIKIGEEAKKKAAAKFALARNGGQPVKKASLVN